MTTIAEVQDAIRAIERERRVLGDVVVDATVAALRAKLDDLQAAQRLPDETAARKQVTVLFAALTGFSSLTDALPQTEALTLMTQIWERLDAAITAHGGQVDKHIGNAVMGVFGVPAVRENDAERAVRAALAMREELDILLNELDARSAEDLVPETAVSQPSRHLYLKIGINTGPVLLGEVGSAAEFTAMGDAVNLASRLQQSAAPNDILISDQTFRLVEDQFASESVGPLTLKGRAQPVISHRILGMYAAPRRASRVGLPGIQPPLVGREAVLQALQVTAQAVRNQGVCRMVTLYGEAGVGKTRVAEEFLRDLQDGERVEIITGRAKQRLRQLNFGLARDILTAMYGLQYDDPAHVLRAKLRRGLAERLQQPEESIVAQARALELLLGLEIEGRVLDPRTAVPQHDGMFREVTRLLATSMDGLDLTVVLLDDLQWSDAVSLELLRFMVAELEARPLLVICVARPALLEEYPDWLTATAVPHEMLLLSPLSDDACQALVEAVLHKLPRIPADLTQRIVQAAGGNPYYVEEIIKVLIEDGAIVVGEDEWALAERPFRQLRVPPTLTGVIQARLDRLSSLERTVLQRAAVVGREFWDNAVIAISAAAPQSHTEEQVRAALYVLVRREMISRLPTSLFTGQQTYAFRHTLLREVAYESVLLRQRPLYHRQAAEWLAAQSGTRRAEFATLIARHYEQAGDKARAAEYYELAADRAVELHDPASAINHYRNVLALLDRPQFVSRTLQLQEHIGDLCALQGRLVEAVDAFRAMRDIAELDGELALEARACRKMARIWHELGRIEPMLTEADHARYLAWLVSARGEEVQALLVVAEAEHLLDNLPAARTSAERALQLSEQRADAVAVARALGALTVLAHAEGKQHSVEACLDQLLAPLTDAHAVDMAPAQLLCVGETLQAVGRWAQAEEMLRAAEQVCRAREDRVALGRALAGLGWVLRVRGAGETAVLTPLREAIATAETVGHLYDALIYRLHLSRALAAFDHTAEAAAMRQDVLDHVRDPARMGSSIHRI